MGCTPCFISEWIFNEHNQNYSWLAGEDSSLTKGVWSVVVCLLAGALHLRCHHFPHTSGVDADTHTSLPATFPVPCPRHGLLGDGFVPVPPLGDTVLLPDLISFQLVGRGPASFAQCLHLCKYNMETSCYVMQWLLKLIVNDTLYISAALHDVQKLDLMIYGGEKHKQMCWWNFAFIFWDTVELRYPGNIFPWTYLLVIPVLTIGLWPNPPTQLRLCFRERNLTVCSGRTFTEQTSIAHVSSNLVPRGHDPFG